MAELSSSYIVYCDAVWNIYPKTGVYFSHMWKQGSLALDPSQNKS